MQTDAGFWDKHAAGYRARPISDEQSYAYTLERTASYLSPDDAVLELGCGTGGTALNLAKFAGCITATDFSRGMIEQALERPQVDNVSFEVADIFDARFASESQDVLLAFNLLHLVPDAARFVARAHDLLPKGGLFISKTPCVSDPSAALKWRLLVKLIPLMQLLGKAPPVRFLTIAELHTLLEEAGFEIVETGNYPVQPPSHFVVARKL